jgi:hypothetical protein
MTESTMEHSESQKDRVRNERQSAPTRAINDVPLELLGKNRKLAEMVRQSSDRAAAIEQERSSSDRPFNEVENPELAVHVREKMDRESASTRDDYSATKIIDRAPDAQDTQVYQDLVSQVHAMERNVDEGMKDLRHTIRKEVGRENLLNRMADFASRMYHLPRDIRAARAARKEREWILDHPFPLRIDATPGDREDRARALRQREIKQNEQEIARASRKYRLDNMTPVGRGLSKIASLVGLGANDEHDVGSVDVDAEGFIREDSVLSPLRENSQEYVSVYDPTDRESNMEISTHAPAYLHHGEAFMDYGRPIIGWVLVDGSDDRYVLSRRQPWKDDNEETHVIELTRIDRETGKLERATTISLTPDADESSDVVSFRTAGLPIQVVASLDSERIRLGTIGKTEIRLLANPGVREDISVPRAA